MNATGRITLTQFLIEQRRRAPAATGELNALVYDVALACKALARQVAHGALAVGDVAATPSGRGKYALRFEALEGASNLDVDGTLGSLFSIVRPDTGGQQVCAGYALYGPATMLVLTLGHGTHAFTLHPHLGEWLLSHADMRIAPDRREFAIDASASRFWEPAIKRYIDECLAGRTGPREADFTMRWVASLVAETHRVLVQGGVCLVPRAADKPGSGLRLLHEAWPIAWLVEQAGGRASDGRRRVLDIAVEAEHPPMGLLFGCSEEIARLEAYHLEEPQDSYRSPLFGHRGLFAQTDG